MLKKHGIRGKKKRVRWIIYGLAFLLLLVVLGVYMFQFYNVSNHEGAGQAAIIDQLSVTYPNTTFWHTAMSIFKREELRTFYVQGGFDTVDFYRGLPSRGFSFIILRAHSAISLETGNIVLFTNEKWSDSKASTTYLGDVMADRLAKVRVEEGSPEYFGIFPNFVRAMIGNFKSAVVVMMGCETLMNPSMAEAFIEKGAKLCIGWTGPVSTGHSDISIIHFLQHLIAENETVSEAVSKTMEEVGEDPYWKGCLVWYPSEGGNLVFAEIIGLGSKNSSFSFPLFVRDNCEVLTVFSVRRFEMSFGIKTCIFTQMNVHSNRKRYSVFFEV